MYPTNSFWKNRWSSACFILPGKLYTNTTTTTNSSAEQQAIWGHHSYARSSSSPMYPTNGLWKKTAEALLASFCPRNRILILLPLLITHRNTKPPEANTATHTPSPAPCIQPMGFEKNNWSSAWFILSGKSYTNTTITTNNSRQHQAAWGNAATHAPPPTQCISS